MDLHDALTTLHREWTADATDRPAGPVVAAARRRRVVRRTGFGAVGAGAVAALVVGGLNVDWSPAPPPPAQTTDAPTPTPTPEPTRTAEPSATPSWTPAAQVPFEPDLALCGTEIDLTAGSSEELGVYTSDAYQVDPGAPLTAPYEVATPGSGGERVTVAPLVSVLVDGSPDADAATPTVIGVAGAALPGRAARTLDGGSEGGGSWASLQLHLELPFVMCPGVDGAGGPPPDGAYVVLTQVELVKDGTTHVSWGAAYDQVGAWPHGPRTYAAEGATRITSEDQSWCGKPAGYTPATPDVWTASTGDVTAEATARLVDGSLVVGLRLANQGPTLRDVEVRYPSYYVVNNAQLTNVYGLGGAIAASTIVRTANIGAPMDMTDALGGPTPTWTPPRDLPNGGVFALETNAGPMTCTVAYGAPWPSGTYTVYAFTEVGAYEGTTPIWAPPVTFTVP